MEQKPLLNSSVNTTDYNIKYSKTENNGNHYEMYKPWTGREWAPVIGIWILFCLLGIIGNGLVIWVSIFRMKKTVNVLWFLSLAATDFSYAFFLPFNISHNILRYWPFGRFMCKFIQFLQCLNLNVSVLQLTVISVDRCICVVFPVWCHNHRRPRLAYCVVLTIWIVASTLAIPSVISIDVYDGRMCRLEGIEHIRLEIFLGFVVLFIVPLIIIVFCNIVIVLRIRQKRLFTSSKSYQTIMALIIAFFICWFPYHLISLLYFFRGGEIDLYVVYYGHLISMILLTLNSCINPILYVFIGRDFKNNFCGSFQATFEKAFIEDEDKEKQERCAALQMLHQDYKVEEVIE